MYSEMQKEMMIAGKRRIEAMKSAAAKALGMSVYDPKTTEIFNEVDDWENYWPVIDSEGNFTGDIIETEEICQLGYFSVMNEAMISPEDVRSGNWQIGSDGFAFKESNEE